MAYQDGPTTDVSFSSALTAHGGVQIGDNHDHPTYARVWLDDTDPATALNPPTGAIWVDQSKSPREVWVWDGDEWTGVTGAWDPETSPPTGLAGGDLTGTYPNPTIKDQAVDGSKLADLAVTSGKIAAGAVLDPHIGDGQVNTHHLADRAVGTDQIKLSAIDSTHIVYKSIVTDRIASDAITAVELASGAVYDYHITAGAVTTAKIAGGAVTSTELAAWAVTTDKIWDGHVTGAKIAPDAVDHTHIGDGEVWDQHVLELTQGKVAGLVDDLASKALKTTRVDAGGVLTGGGDLAAWRTIRLDLAVPGLVDGNAESGLAVSTQGTGGLQLDWSFLDNHYVEQQGDKMGGPLLLHDNAPMAVDDDPTEAVPRGYVDAAVESARGGQWWKAVVKVVATSDVPTLSGSGVVTIDGSLVWDLDDVLLTAQTDPADNGIWTVDDGAWYRREDFDGTSDYARGAMVWVSSGSQHADTMWRTTSFTGQWKKVGPAVAGAGLAANGTVIDLVAADSTLSVAPDSVAVAHAPRWSTKRTLRLQGDVEGEILNAVDGSADIILDTSLSASLPTLSKKVLALPAGNGPEVFNHYLGTTDVQVEVYRTATGDTVLVDIDRGDPDQVVVMFDPSVSYAAGEYTCVVVG